MKKQSLLLTCAIGGLSCTSVVAHAADAKASAANEPTELQEVVVTAQKRAQSVQKVPEAVTAFTAKQRAIEGITTFQDMTNFTPGLTYSTSLDRVQLRGVGRLSNDLSADAAVAIYNDDLYATSSFLVGLDDLFIDRVEIERGPQGTLYGRNAIGGLINTISKRPTDQLSGEVRVGYANYNRTNLEGTISGPVAPNLNFRLSGYYINQADGYFKNLAGPQQGGIIHDWYADAQLEWRPTAQDDVWVDLRPYGWHNDSSGQGSLLDIPQSGPYDTDLAGGNFSLGFNPNFGYSALTGFSGGGTLGTALGPVPGSVVGKVPGLTANPPLGSRTIANSLPTKTSLTDTYNLNFHWLHHFDGADLKYVGGYSQYHYAVSEPATTQDGNSSITQYQIPLGTCFPGGHANFAPSIYGCGTSPLTVFPEQSFDYVEQNRYNSHEVTLSSTNGGSLQWIAGAYFYLQDFANTRTISALRQAQLASPVMCPTLIGCPATAAAPNPGRNLALLFYQMESRSEAVYGQVDWKVTDTVKLTGGLRYTNDQKIGSEAYRAIAFSDKLGGLGFTAEQLGNNLPAVDITALAIGPTPLAYRGVTGGGFLPNGQFRRSLNGNSNAITGTAGVEWTPDSRTLAYARYNRGYKALGFNLGNISANPEAAPETLDDFEIGLKQSISRSFQYNVALFHYAYHNDQVPLLIATTSGLFSEFVNVPEARSEGIEVQAEWRPVADLDLNFTYAYDDTAVLTGCAYSAGVYSGACYQDAVDPNATAPGAHPVGPHANGVQSVKGQSLPQAPKNKVAFNANYTFHFDPGDLILSGSYVWKDKSYDSIFDRSFHAAPSWNQVDLRGTWVSTHDRHEVVAYVKNVFNSLGYDSASEPLNGTGGSIIRSYDLTPPRTFGVEVHYKF